MNVYQCPHCAGPLYFENAICGCGQAVVYHPEEDRFTPLGIGCANRMQIGCNWVASGSGELCEACAMTVTRPDENVADNTLLWARAEAAKRWALVNLRRWGWFGASDAGARPVFNILSEHTASGPAQPVMGHADGRIQINVAEADPTELARMRSQMSESYRTMLGHFRHEIAHFLWLRLSAHDGFVARSRNVFGDESADYAEALERHYASGPPAGWESRHISAYASSHPHEDWAETAAHVLHLTDLVHSAQAVGMTIPASPMPRPGPDVLAQAQDLAIALNHVNRAMGLDDPYPFVVSENVLGKLTFVLQAVSAGP